MRLQAVYRRISALAGLLLVQISLAQTPTTVTGEPFGTVIPLGGTPSDVVLDEFRGRLYLVISGANRVTVYNYKENRVTGHIGVGSFPISAALSMDSRQLYVTNAQGASMTIVDLATDSVVQTVGLPARPEGVAVGFDGRVLITTQGTGTNNTLNTLLLFDATQSQLQQLTPVPSPPTISTPNPLPAVFIGRPATAFPGRLTRTPDGQFIIGMVAINQTANNAQTTLFVYEVASGTVLRNRTVTGQSTVLSMAPDGSRFMAGSTLYDAATLTVIGSQSTANLPFLITIQANNPAINAAFNYGGSAFSPDGGLLYSAFNVAANNVRPLSEALFVSHPKNLGARIGLRMPESILGNMVVSSDGATIWAASESGLIHVPIGRMFEFPILEPDTNTVFLSVDDCNKGIAKASVRINNIGGGKLTFSVPNITTALVTQVASGLAPSTVTFVMEPGRSGVARRPGTNLFTGAAGGNGAPINVAIASREAINFPNTVRVFMNFREREQRGVVFPVPRGLNNAEGIHELILDEPRGLLYLSNSGFNRIEVFDIRKQRFLDPIVVGQLPHSIAISVDRNTLYVGNSGGESISIVDLETRKITGEVEFPAIPRAGNQLPVRPLAMTATLSGLQFIMSNGGLWRLIGNQAVPRPGSALINPNNPNISTLAGGVYYMSSTPGGEYAVLVAGNGNAYLYDALADGITASRQVLSNPIQSYFGPTGAAPGANYFLVNGLILSPALAIVGGAERPGATQMTPGGPGQPPTQTVISTGTRHITAVYPLDGNIYVRMTLPVRQNLAQTTRDDPRPTLELVDVRSGAESIVAISPDNPNTTAFGTGRVNVPTRQLAVDSQGNAYAITLSGLTVVPLATSRAVVRPAVTAGSRAIVNANDGTTSFGPGSFINVSGANLASSAAADQIPLPSVLGGSCLTFSDIPLPLLETAPGRIVAQVPDNLRPGVYLAQVRSLNRGEQSDPVLVTVQRPQ